MTDFNKILVVLDVYNDFRVTADSLPLEVTKAIGFVGNR